MQLYCVQKYELYDLISSMPRCFWASQVDVSGGEGFVGAGGGQGRLLGVVLPFSLLGVGASLAGSWTCHRLSFWAWFWPFPCLACSQASGFPNPSDFTLSPQGERS